MKKFKTDEYSSTNAISNRIEKIIKNNDFEKSVGNEKYEIVTSFRMILLISFLYKKIKLLY